MLLAAVTRLYLISLPVFIALILATLAVPPARALEHRGAPPMLAALAVVVGGIGYERARIDDLVERTMGCLEESAGDTALEVGDIAIALAQGLTAVVLALILLFFFVKDREQIVGWCRDRVPSRHREVFHACGARAWTALAEFVHGTAAVALIDAVGIGVGLVIVDVPLVLPLAVLVFFGAFVPVVGAFVTGLLAALVALASQGPTTALIVVGIVLAVQQVESNILQPRIMRRTVALHPVVILAVLTIGVVLIGVAGAFIAVPVTAVCAAVGNELRLRREVAVAGGRAGPEPIG